MKKAIQYYIIVMAVLCFATLGFVGIITAGDNTSSVSFGTQSQKIKLDADEIGTELESIFTFFLPSR